MSPPRAAAHALVALAIATSARAASADVVPSPPAFCGPGKTAVSDHRGARCEPNAPRDCPPGWKGVLGGTCILHSCKGDPDCAGDARCVATDVCVEERPRYWEYDRKGGEPAREIGPSDNASEPPPAPDPSHPVLVAIEPCGEARACAAPATCRPFSVCLPKGASRPSPKPANSDVQRGTIPVAARRSCGCDVAGAPGGSLAALAAAALALGAAARRRISPKR